MMTLLQIPSSALGVARSALGVSPLAEILLPPAGSQWPFAANVLMWGSILTMFGGLILILKKLFGRQPSFGETLAKLVSIGRFDEYREEQRLRAKGLEAQISQARHSFDERANTDLFHCGKLFDGLINRMSSHDKVAADLRDSVSRLHERTETHLRKLDQYDTKLDNLLRDVSRAAAAGVRSAQ